MEEEQYIVKNDIEEKIIKAYMYGSVVYECATAKSDNDFIVVVESNNPDLYYSVKNEEGDFTIYSEQKFISLIKEHHISVLECIFQSPTDPYRQYFNLDLSKLRRSISAVVSNSFGKAFKKMKDGEQYIGEKSLFHAFRITDYGIQIALYGEIRFYGTAKAIHAMVMDNCPADIDECKKKFKPLFNQMRTNFKKLAPLEEEKNG